MQKPTHAYQLAESFEDVLVMLKNKRIDIAVVPHAYGNINIFYMDQEIYLANLFVFSTPIYGLAQRTSGPPIADAPVLVTHPAPIPLLRYLVDRPEEYRVELVSSTSMAAERVKNQTADLALTNEVACRRHGLTFVRTYGPIAMSWSVFARRDGPSIWDNRS